MGLGMNEILFGALVLDVGSALLVWVMGFVGEEEREVVMEMAMVGLDIRIQIIEIKGQMQSISR